MNTYSDSNYGWFDNIEGLGKSSYLSMMRYLYPKAFESLDQDTMMNPKFDNNRSSLLMDPFAIRSDTPKDYPGTWDLDADSYLNPMKKRNTGFPNPDLSPY